MTEPKTPKNHVFAWSYKNPDRKGAVSTGEIEAVTLNAARSSLRRRGLDARYLTIKKRSTGLMGQKIKPADIVGLLRQLSTLQNAGVSTMEGLQMLRLTSKKPGMKSMVQKMIQHLSTGNQLSDALALFPAYFDHISVSLIRAGEQGGVMDTVLRNIAEYKEKDFALKKKIRSALMYPGITVLVMIVVVIILMVKVIPVFAHLFTSFGSQLPYLTQLVVDLSDWMKSHVVILLLAPVLTIAGFLWSYRRFKSFRWWADRVSLHIPVIGPLLLKGATARFMKTLALLQGAGVPIHLAMETLSHVSGNSVIDDGISRATKNVIAGGTIADGLKGSALPELSIQMLSIGEKSGSVEAMATKTGEFYEGEVNEMVERMSTLLEPFIMIFLGVVIGTLVVAMYLPMLDMGQAILVGSGVKK
ncbi:type II secretion system F family protein [Acidithiobacillus ferridurans]|uniref:Type II secretion system F family protein n=1 Tax=Acidithiobacillus ferridurans TaxID=1232575 RepID=A0A8X8K980_ACIFI|nr:type II secretion system F family protein [Acidithiobacillus ferridurans]MBU2717297.1 type II secretion system F family protein [Acidithiobacillus ferridurans]MBU2721822.1 type II secretion system F family protein [Acidithiobacillus ferridurans]MBU2726329.1 type II secretion system F family protein [Acidithiobacillus ferridurans]